MKELDQVKENIARAAKRAGRKPEDVTLIAVSKRHDADAIRPLLEAGHRDFGENRVQEAQDKWHALKAEYPDVRLHMVGQLQSNKAADAAEIFDVIHSLDRTSLLKELAKLETKPACYIQIDIGEEDQKGGLPIKQLEDFHAKVKDAGIPVAGLMAMPPQGVEASPFFALTAELARRHGIDGLSMGMSSDYEEAVMLGATAVRIGTALFGARD
ncbi:YggS family pyridoxal phosphate-dependent enzyme [Sphingomicrobium marinum]|uniref:YggS family pyridoxal phosphate-dependent enzyme n=1 Tax=Sphingomicrobium marinum TaxID=1227950 RepID=UPI00223F2B9C|nr:YggS family pyridoxal phosphate-dependent enzyme [Sphingomicrobium marinum]